MGLFLTWILIILLCSVLTGILGVQILRWLDRIEPDEGELIQPSGEMTIPMWLRERWQILRTGKYHLRDLPARQTDIEQALPEGAVNVETNPQEESKDRKLPVGLTSNVMLALEIPVGARIQITIDTSSDAAGVSIVDVQTEPDSNLAPVKVQIVSTGATGVKTKPKVMKPSAIKADWSAARAKTLAWLQKIPLGPVLFGLALIVYLVSRLIGLDRFPIYFFTDESIHTILAQDLVNNHFRYNGQFLPTYFSMGASFGLNSISVYLQVIPYLLFGKSVFVTRAVSVIISLLGATAVGLILKDYFKSRYWWSGVLILSIIPAWFLHSRTAFESIELASFYAIFLYFYLGYRLRSPYYLFPAIIAGGLVFYTHGLGQFLMVVTTVLLLLVDLPYHWKQRKMVLLGLLLIGIMAVPYFRFSHSNSTLFIDELRARGSYWLDKNLSLTEKSGRFVSEYLSGFSPKYWFLPDTPRDLVRHQMKGYGHISILGLPFFLYGLWLVIKNIRLPAYRTVLVALLAAPFGAATAQITILRVIWFVIPAALLITLGLGALLSWLEKRRFSYPVLAISVFVVLAGINLYMLQDVLRNGPLWYTDYSLYGMQYGAEQLFGEAIPQTLQQEPGAHFVVTPTWANGTDNFVRFFLNSDQQSHVRLDSIQAYLFKRLPIEDNTYVVLTQAEYDQAKASPKFKDVDPQKIIYYPDGTPGFYFVRLAYSDTADQIFAAEKIARSQPVEGEVQIGDQTVKIRYSQIDMGGPQNIFDGDTYTLMRGLEANPFVIELDFREPRPIQQIIADFANMDFTLTNILTGVKGDPVTYTTTQRGVQGDPHVEMIIDKGPDLVSKLRMEILSLNGGEQPHIHIRELKLVP